MRIEYHRTLIADRVRIEAFHKALASVIRLGETAVADLGAGTGIMGLLAAKLGAREVYLYEAAEVARVADEVVKASRAKCCHVMPCHSTEMQDPPRVDVIVSETLGNYALEENIIDTIADGRRRHLKDGGLIIPRRISQFATPVVSDRIHRELTVWDEVDYDLNLAAPRIMSLNNVYVRTLEASELLDEGRSARVWDEIDLESERRSSRKGEASWKLSHQVTVYGFAYWWVAELVPGIALSTAPGAPRTHWEQLYFPLLEPIAAKPSETVMVALSSRTSEAAGTHLAWTAVHFDADGKHISRQALDLDKGWLP